MSKLVNNESVEETYVYVADFEHIAANTGASAQVTIGKIPAGGAVKQVVVHEAVALAGASDITLDVGKTPGDPDEYIDALDIDAMTVPVYNTGDAFASSNSAGVELVGESATDVDIVAEWNGTTGDLTAGKVVVAITVVNLGKFA
jgi:hypothetical protein